ncbi:MAG: PAS domain-containing protein [Gemmatimonadetes bacterium]|nr:PAS domain-containing protein [Gemmatimonadota bacterium]
MTTTLREPLATGPSFPMELLARCTASSAAAWADHLAESNLIVDAEGLVLWANARACDRLGVESGRRLTVRDCDRLAPLDLSGAREEGKRFHALLTGRSPSGAPFMRGVLDSTGVRSWLRLHVTPLEADDATAHWSGISFTNVSSVVESTAGHREAQLRADAILDALVEGIVLVDADDVIRYVNPATLRMLGYADDAEIIGRRRTELPVRRFHADGREAAPPTLTSWAGESMPTRERLRYIGFPRGELWLDTQVSRLSLGDPDGKASGAVVSFVNVSEAVRAEAQCRAVVHASPLGIVLVDREGHIAMANAAAQRLLGLRREGPEAPFARDATWARIRLDGSLMPREDEPIAQSLATGRTVEGEVQGLRRPDGTTHWLRVSAAPMHGIDGRLEGVVAHFADCTSEISGTFGGGVSGQA